MQPSASSVAVTRSLCPPSLRRLSVGAGCATDVGWPGSGAILLGVGPRLLGGCLLAVLPCAGLAPHQQLFLHATCHVSPHGLSVLSSPSGGASQVRSQALDKYGPWVRSVLLQLASLRTSRWQAHCSGFQRLHDQVVLSCSKARVCREGEAVAHGSGQAGSERKVVGGSTTEAASPLALLSLGQRLTAPRARAGGAMGHSVAADWGRHLVDLVERAREGVFAKRRPGGGLSPLVPEGIILGTDCSGAEAPVWALRGMGVKHTHAFSSDVWPAARKFLRANACPAGPIFEDMLARPLEQVPDHNVYVCGFPCKAFSRLHHGTQFFKEPAARPFKAMLDTVAGKLPALAIFENVTGILMVRAKLEKYVQRKLGGRYQVVVVQMDPTSLGAPVRRPRLYMIAVRMDVLLLTPGIPLEEYVLAVLDAVRRPVVTRASDILLPARHPAVQARLSSAHRAHATRQSAPRSSLEPGVAPRWREVHKAMRQGLARGLAQQAACPLTAEQLFLTSPRERDLWQLLQLQHSGSWTGMSVDLSQAAGRTPTGHRGLLPCVTPKAKIVVVDLRRCMLPVEKLLVHGFPIEDMVTDCVTDTELATLGGNTMHLHCVGLALLLGFGLVDWGAARRVLPVPPPHGSARRFMWFLDPKPETAPRKRPASCMS